MQFYILGAAVFLFVTSVALNIHSYMMLNRAIDILRFILEKEDDFQVSKKGDFD